MTRKLRAVAFTRDRHPPNHCSFQPNGGPWPVHCVDGTEGFEFHPEIQPPAGAVLVDKGTRAEEDNFDGFHATSLGEVFRALGIERVFVVGLATEYCVKATVMGALREGFETWVALDAVAGVERRPGDVERALVEMRTAGAELAESGQATTLLVRQRRPSALVVVDLQKDFFSGGALAVRDSERVLPPIRRLLAYYTGGR